jgi:hypothetical protein
VSHRILGAGIEYFVSKFQKTETIENTPKMKLPITLTIKTLAGRHLIALE